MAPIAYLTTSTAGLDDTAAIAERSARLADVLAAHGYHPYAPSTRSQAPRGRAARELAVRDLDKLSQASLLVAELAHPCTGVGIELAHAAARRIPTVALAFATSPIPPLVVELLHRSDGVLLTTWSPAVAPLTLDRYLVRRRRLHSVTGAERVNGAAR